MFDRFNNCKQLHSSEKGDAVVEFAVIAPVLVFLIFGAAYLGHALVSYLALTQIVGQEVQLLMTQASPEIKTAFSFNDCAGSSLSSLKQTPEQIKIHQHIRESVRLERVNVAQQSFCITSTVAPPVKEAGTAEARVGIHVSGSFGSLIPGLSGLPFVVEAKSWKVS